ncbi:MAG: stage II sporulation protein M [Acidilobaceae archaeon]|nr:stage II sporulation protein M [Acidilobaceae archaeon]MCX8165496.1 stage II sporulation protein M [Acidilobaceae archaeon]MDW7973923.1 stage II sporulation protein M [Sulfolobales archaeon]
MSFLDILLDRTFAYTWIGFTLLFGLSATLSSALYFSYDEQVKGLVEELIAERMEQLEGLPLPDELLFAVIFSNNAVIALVSSLLSFSLIVPLLIIMFNGAVVGFLISAVSAEASLGPLLGVGTYFLLAPHGVLEVPALSLASSAVVGILARKNYPRFVIASSLLALLMLLHAALVEQLLFLLAR